MHKDHFFTNYYIKGFPLHVFRQSILPSSGGHFGLYIDQCTCVNDPLKMAIKIAEIRVGEIL
jgi:hypothetical protein